MAILDQIDHIVILMMENRSFDHALGYLSTPNHGRKDIEGVDLNRFNTFNGKTFPVIKLAAPTLRLAADPPHERPNISLQLGTQQNGVFPMDGFVKNLASVLPQFGAAPFVMGYWDEFGVPAFDFFAKNYVVCDHWFSAIPAGTQPNRLMAMSGETQIDLNARILPKQDLVYDWLDRLGIRWRVYHDGEIPFMMLMEGWQLKILTSPKFKPFSRLSQDLMREDPKTFPQVIFIEPTYTNAPHLAHANDDHAPSPISNGQNFMLQVYMALTSNPDRWKKTMLVSATARLRPYNCAHNPVGQLVPCRRLALI